MVDINGRLISRGHTMGHLGLFLAVGLALVAFQKIEHQVSRIRNSGFLLF
jgi:hypothetical protein